MKLYIANGLYVGTQAEAKAITKDYSQVEVPTDKPGLIEYLNSTQIDADKHQDLADEFTNVYERQDPPVDNDPFVIGDTVDLDTLFDRAPISHRLRLAVGAIDAADAAIRTLDNIAGNAVSTAKKAVEQLVVTGEDDELFG